MCVNEETFSNLYINLRECVCIIYIYNINAYIGAYGK